MGIKCLSFEHNAVPWPGLKPRQLNPESSTLTIRLQPHPRKLKEPLNCDPPYEKGAYRNSVSRAFLFETRLKPVSNAFEIRFKVFETRFKQ